MKTQNARLSLAAVLVVLVALLSACGGGGGPRPQPPPTARATIAFVVTSGGQPVADAVVDTSVIPSVPDGTTNTDGYLALDVPVGVLFAAQVTREGYVPWWAEVSVVANTQLEIVLERDGPPAPPAGTPPWPGRLGLSGGCFRNGAGACELPLFMHFGESFSRYTHDGRAEIVDQARAVKAAAYDGIRFWDTLGYYDHVWSGAEVMPWAFRTRSGRSIAETPDYYGSLTSFLSDLRAIGLTTQHSRGDLNGTSLSRVVQHAERVASLYDQVGWETLALAEGNNEDWQNGDFGPDGLRAIVAPFERRGALTALSSGVEAEEAHVLRAYATRLFYVHGARGPGYPLILRHIFSLAREAMPGWRGWQGEPAGPGDGVTGGQVNDSEMLALMAAQAWVSRQAWTYMSSHGVFYRGRLESQPGFWVVPRIRDAMEAFGRDLMTWNLTHRSAGDAALRSDKPTADGDARVDQTIAPDGRVAAVAYDPSGRQAVQNVTGRRLSCDVIGVSGEDLTHHGASIGPGDWLSLDYRVGRLLLCTPQ